MSAHDEYVAAGNCPSVSPFKAWCNERAGHLGLHRAPFVNPPPSTKVQSVHWDHLGRFAALEEH